MSEPVRYQVQAGGVFYGVYAMSAADAVTQVLCFAGNKPVTYVQPYSPLLVPDGDRRGLHNRATQPHPIACRCATPDANGGSGPAHWETELQWLGEHRHKLDPRWEKLAAATLALCGSAHAEANAP